MKLLTLLELLLAGYVISVPLVAWRVYHSLFLRRVHGSEEVRITTFEDEEYDRAFLDLKREPFKVASPYGYTLKGEMLLAGDDAPVALFVHGIRWTRVGMYKYMKHFVARGWTVAAIDLAGHGETGLQGTFGPSFGLNERRDVATAVEALRARFPEAPLLGIVGESMGAASSILAAALENPRMDFVIADCSFSSIREAIFAQMKQSHIPWFVGIPSFKLVSGFARGLRKVDLRAAAPMEAAKKAKVPMLFIHGREDTYVPPAMSEKMHEARLSSGAGLSECLIIPGARHAKSVIVDPQAWVTAAFGFIERVKAKAGERALH